MPRARQLGPVPTSTGCEDYFDSLADLARWAQTPRPAFDEFAPTPPAPLPTALLPSDDSQRGKVLACHDYKGGYREISGEEREYTFEHLRSIDTFVYFSHRRITCPPKSSIRTAHAAGTAILGTLIFEWDAGKADIVELVTTDGSDGFLTVNTRYPDMLVALTRERDFDGWLINVEVDLGIESAPDSARKHAAALVSWLAYFSAALKGAMPHAQVLWYDAVTVEGKLQWQNSLNDLNLPFFQACDGIFCNYWWREEHLQATSKFLQEVAPWRAQDVYFGIDVFGRGTYAGGGFETWRAMYAVQEAPPAGTPKFSTALFAPGWTVEAESLQHSLTSPDAHARWRADDRYFWGGGPPTPSVVVEAARQTRERREQRGVQRARQLAALTAPSASPIPLRFRAPVPAEFDYNGPLPLLPGSEIATSRQNSLSFCPQPRPVPCPDFHFYTNFSAGSGHDFFVAGQKVINHDILEASERSGWTDVDFLAAQPIFETGGAVAFDERDAWEGERCLVVDQHAAAASEPTAEASLGLFDLSFPPVRTAFDLDLLLVHKLATPSSKTLDSPRLFIDGKGVQQAQEDVEAVHELANGWRLSRTRCRLGHTDRAGILHLGLHVDAGVTCRVGAVCVVPKGTRPTVHLLSPRSVNDDSITWRNDLVVRTPSTTPVPVTLSPAHIFLADDQNGEKYLGSTFDRKFHLGVVRPQPGQRVRLVSGGTDAILATTRSVAIVS